MEEYTPETQEDKSEELKRWFQDNLRIVVSIAIVFIIAGGIYSYSKRGETLSVNDQEIEKVSGSEDSIEIEAATDTDEQSAEPAKKETVEKAADKAVTEAVASKETDNSFVETATKNDGLTVLARRATANYLEKNQDSALTKEHKIYIEDYLRKNVSQKGGIKVGTSVEFSKDLIQKAIEKSKTLNENQLKNLQKYSARVSTL